MSSVEARNALADQKSPFLQHGAGQPVKWMPWGEEAFRRATDLDRPILLDIGAVWCHWCHVMDAESYEDEETARLINERFVAVKVDRDERPDVDARYQRAVQLLTGQGGWPLTAFLDPQGEVFYGGTYFPPIDAHGRPSFRRVLREVSRIWTDDRTRATQAATSIRERLETYVRAEAQPGTPDETILDEAIEDLAQTFDFRYGGFGRAPRFPNAGALDLLIDVFLDNGTDWAARMVSETLHAMVRGGIYDQIGGGFHRYSTDARWIIPHFEKMAYDNGALLETVARAAAVLDAPTLAWAGAGIIAHYQDIAPDLVVRGGFPASQDADFGFDNDGDYWTWTEDEIRSAIGDDEQAKIVMLRFGFDDPAGRMHIDRSRHVLFQAMDEDAISARTGLSADEVRRVLGSAVPRLKAMRDKRPRPFVDESQYSGWVGLVASGHFAAARWLDRHEAGAAATRALDRLWVDAWTEGRGLRHRTDDDASEFFLDDQAHVALALFDAWELTQADRDLERCRHVVDTMIDRFRDRATGAFRDRPAEPAPVQALVRVHTPIADSPTPSGNGSAALVLQRLHASTGEQRYGEIAAGVLHAFAGTAGRMGSGAATWLKALAWSVRPVTTVVIVDEAKPAESALFHAALRSTRPRVSIRYLAPAAVDVAKLPPELAAMVNADAPRAYVCVGRTCAVPTDEARILAETLRTFRG